MYTFSYIRYRLGGLMSRVFDPSVEGMVWSPIGSSQRPKIDTCFFPGYRLPFKG